MKYVMLTNKENYGTIIKYDNQFQHVYSDKHDWTQTTLMDDYLLPDSKYFGMYLEISKEKAYDLIRLLKAVSIWGD